MIRNRIVLTAAIAACCLLGRVSVAEAQDGCPAGGCTKTVCRPVVENKTVTTRVYIDVTKEFCTPCTAFRCLFPNKCGCSHVHTRKVLVLKIRKCDQCVTKCIPVHVPTCETCGPACSAPCASGCLPAAPAGQPGFIAIPSVTTMPSGPVAMPSIK